MSWQMVLNSWRIWGYLYSKTDSSSFNQCLLKCFSTSSRPKLQSLSSCHAWIDLNMSHTHTHTHTHTDMHAQTDTRRRAHTQLHTWLWLYLLSPLSWETLLSFISPQRMETSAQRSSWAVKTDTPFQPGQNQKKSKGSGEKGSAPWHGPDRKRSKCSETTPGAFHHVGPCTDMPSGCLLKQLSRSQWELISHPGQASKMTQCKCPLITMKTESLLPYYTAVGQPKPHMLLLGLW